MVARSGQQSDVVVKPSVKVVPASCSHFFVLGSTAGSSITPFSRMSSRRKNRMFGRAFCVGLVVVVVAPVVVVVVACVVVVLPWVTVVIDGRVVDVAPLDPRTGSDGFCVVATRGFAAAPTIAWFS